jgi:hypothetical protein
MRAAWPIASALPTDVPPNFITKVPIATPFHPRLSLFSNCITVEVHDTLTDQVEQRSPNIQNPTEHPHLGQGQHSKEQNLDLQIQV